MQDSVWILASRKWSNLVLCCFMGENFEESVWRKSWRESRGKEFEEKIKEGYRSGILWR